MDMPLSDANLDLDLLRRLRSGDHAALTSLYQRHQGSLYRFAILRAGSTQVAADVVQDVFIALIENKLKFDPTRGALLSFLFGVTRNLILKRDEAERRFLPIARENHDNDANTGDNDMIDPRPLPLEKILADARAEQVRQALLTIAPHYRDVLILYEMHDMSYVDIAAICHIDIGTVRSRLSRARAKIAALLGADQTNQPANPTPPTTELRRPVAHTKQEA